MKGDGSMKKFLHELLMFFVGLIGVGIFAVALLYFILVDPIGQEIFEFVLLFAVFRVSAELIIEWSGKRKKNKEEMQKR